jgi:hypothetical protein
MCGMCGVCGVLRFGMATLKVEDVPDELLRGVRVEAAASGRTVRGLVIAALERIAAGEVQADQAPTEPHKQGATAPSPRTRSGSLGRPRARNQARKRPRSTIDAVAPAPAIPAAPREQIKPCSHGLLFHPGCTDPGYTD